MEQSGGFVTVSKVSNIIRYSSFTILILFLTIMLIGSVAHTYQAVPVRTGDTPTVFGDAAFQGSVQKAMDYLKAEYPADYANVNLWLVEIRPTDTYTRVDSYGACYVNGNDSGASTYWLAGVLIHEAQHAADDHGYFVDHPYSDRASEQRALTSQVNYLGSVSGWTQQQDDDWVNGWLAKQYWVTIPAKYSS